MARPSGPKTRCGGQWTEARFRSFIKSGLRALTVRWAPIQNCKKNARVGRGEYLCAGCKQHVPATRFDEALGKRVNNIFVDHIDPIVNPETGFTNWDDVIEKMFCEEDNLALLCDECHKTKTQQESAVAKERRLREKQND